MMRPPENGGGRDSGFAEYDDADIEPKRGTPDEIDQHPDTRPGDVPTDQGGQDGGASFPGAEDDNLPERLGERIENGSSSAMATGGPDVFPDVEPPESTM